MSVLRITGWLLMVLLSGCNQSAEDAVVASQAAVVDDAAPQSEVRNRGVDTANWWDALPRPQWAQFERLDSGDGWFETYQVGPGVIAIYEPGQFEEVISYLILGSERALLFDTGLGIGNMRDQVEALTELPVVVLNSHSHYDHIGGNSLFTRIYGPDLPYTAARTAGVGHAEVAEMVAPAWVWKPLPPGFEPAGYRIGAYQISEYVGEGSIIDLGGRKLEVLMTPGHAPDSLCLLDREGRLLFVGDTFYPAPLYTHIAGASFDDYVNSANRLAAVAPLVDYLFPGHNVGRVAPDYLAAMADAFALVSAAQTDPDSELAFVATDGNRQYQFDGFSIIVAD